MINYRFEMFVFIPHPKKVRFSSIQSFYHRQNLFFIVLSACDVLFYCNYGWIYQPKRTKNFCSKLSSSIFVFSFRFSTLHAFTTFCGKKSLGLTTHTIFLIQHANIPSSQFTKSPFQRGKVLPLLYVARNSEGE